MVGILIIRCKRDLATEYTNWIGDGMKAYLESKGHTVTDLRDEQANPENVKHWLKHSDKNTTKAVIALDHGSCQACYGERNNVGAPVINLANVEELTKELHIYTLACTTNGNSCIGQKAVEKGCYSWLGYTEPVYAMKSDEFKKCIWSYMEAMAEGKNIEQCEATLRKAYQDRKGMHFVYEYNLDRLLLRKRENNMTINSHNRAKETMPKYVSYWDASNWNSWAEVLNLQARRADYRITVYDRDGSVRWQDTQTLTPHETERIFIDEHIPSGGRREGLVVIEPVKEGDEFPTVLTIRGEGQNYKEGNRFVPFIRVPR